MTTEFNGTGNDGGAGSIEILQAANCRFAYTLNNTQPVRCSIIGDQPLFFMDFDGDMIDDEFIDEDINDPFGIGVIEQGVAALKERIMGFDSYNQSELAEIRYANFVDEAREMLGERPMPLRDHAFRLKSIEKALQESRFVAALLETAKTHGISLAFSAQIEQAFYDRGARIILLNPDRDETDLLLLCIRELRRVWQHKNGSLLHPLTFQPDQAILVNRAQHADLSVAMVRGAWELQLAGNKDLWERLEGSSNEDLTRAFAREAYLDFRTIANGQAASAAFEAWFLSDRCRHEDRALIQGMLSDYQGYVFDNEQASKSVGADLVLALGSLPFGKNYLAPFVSTIISDPLFSEVRDRSNANFLWFIKFERSFREAEQDLQTSSTIQDPAVPHGSSITKKLDGDDNEQRSTILALPGRMSGPVSQPKLPAAARADSANGRKDNPDENDAGNIVYFNTARKTGKR